MDIPGEVLVALQGMLTALERVRPAHVRALMQASREVQGALEGRLKALAPGTYSTQEVRGKLAQVRAAVEVLGVEYGRRVGSEVERIGRVASAIGHDGLLAQLKAWSPQFPGAARMLSNPKAASDALDANLLEYYQRSRETYGLNAIAKMKGVLARAALEGKTIVETWEGLSEELALPAWKAERIVRTEQAFASSRRQLLDTIDAYGDEAEALFVKQLHATFDNRTGEDSVRVHGQIRRLTEPFSDGQREYQHPPNRPNDREVMLLVPRDELASEEGAGGAAAPAEAKTSLPPLAAPPTELHQTLYERGYEAVLAEEPYPWLDRKSERYRLLGSDPSNAGFRQGEAELALLMERAGRWSGTRRDPTGKGDFIALGIIWDIKAFRSHVPTKSNKGKKQKGAFVLDKALKTVIDELKMGRKVVVDTRHMSSEDLAILKISLTQHLLAEDLAERIEYYP